MLRQLWPAVLVLSLALPAFGADQGASSTMFKVRIENVSTTSTLQPSDGKAYPAPNSPGVWLVHRGKSPLFVSGKPDMGHGLEPQAEEGNPTSLAQWLGGEVGKSVQSTGVFNTPVGDSQPGPLLPGKAYEFTVSATPGCKLSFTSMFAQSNDLFYAPTEKGITLFDRDAKPIRGDVTRQVLLWDAGTEVNQEPGVGKDQAPRQSAPNTGADEHGVVHLVHDPFTYPATSEVIRVTITPVVQSAMQSR
jgi:hypothetical protein